MKAVHFKPASGMRLADEVANQIKENILNGNLSLGDRLPPERELAKTFNTSSVVLREALHQLQASGLLNIKRGATGGAFISEPNYSLVSESLSTLLQFGHVSIDQLTEARIALEPEVAGLAALRRTDEDIEILQRNLDESRALGASSPERRILHLEFHRLLAAITANPFFIAGVNSIIDNLKYNISKAKLGSDAVSETTCHHTDLIQAIVDQDQDLARTVMLDHIRQIQTSISTDCTH
jgi:DNA-binding FadR family transcriptional regulator